VSSKGYSLVEVIVAAAIVAVGLTAAAVLASTLMQQQELNAATLRAANLQEQAAKLYRLDMLPSELVDLLPEKCARVGIGVPPPPGGYGFSFSRAAPLTLSAGTNSIVLESALCTMVYPNPAQASGILTNSISVIRPSIRVKYNQD